MTRLQRINEIETLSFCSVKNKRSMQRITYSLANTFEDQNGTNFIEFQLSFNFSTNTIFMDLNYSSNEEAGLAFYFFDSEGEHAIPLADFDWFFFGIPY